MSRSARLYLNTFTRAFAIVTCTAMNVRQVSQGHYWGALLVGFLISWFWFKNARSAAHDTAPLLRETYAAGAACGTVFGMWLAVAIYHVVR